MVYFGFDDMSHKAEGKKEKEERNNLYIKKDVHNMHISCIKCTFGQVFTLNTTCITYFKNTGSL